MNISPLEAEDLVRPLSDEAYRIFEEKGKGNSVKVRRIIQITTDLAGHEFHQLKILDLGCGEGVYALEAGLRGAQVLAIDARPERLEQGRQIAQQLNLSNVQFIQDDVRHISKEKLGEFNVVYFLGLLYHLDIPDVFQVVEKVYELCRGFAIIDTHISLDAYLKVDYKNVEYFGSKYKEHSKTDPVEVKAARQLASLDNKESFWFSQESLIRLLYNTGFTTVFVCHAPPEPNKPEDRLTLVASKGRKEWIASYPWLNNLTEKEVAELLKEKTRLSRFKRFLKRIKRWVN
jgi:2-polyprenyl-3-methyl-5-hydroxy-6-metoxy-1,4-benzoquinol methylase